jgi:huntingtin-interacting protein 1-related protein
VYTWDHKSSLSFWAGMKVYEYTPSQSSSKSSAFSADATRAYYDWNRARQPVMADEVQTFKALITIHKVLQEGHPITVKEAQQNVNWIESLARGVTGEGLRGTPESLGMTKQELAKLLKRRMDTYEARKN